MEIAQKLAYGKHMHVRARAWFSKLPGFVFAEGRLEGGYVGINGVVGQLDFLLGKSVLEFKTKAVAPDDIETLLRDFPQDLEQNLFYAVLLPDAADEHHLVFLNGEDESFRAFRVRVKDRGRILNLLRMRIQVLRAALESGDSTSLGRCRYFESGCKFHLANVCPCAELAPLGTAALPPAAEVSRDQVLEVAIASARQAAGRDSERIWTWDILSPRRRFLRKRGLAPAYTQDTAKIAVRYILAESVAGTPDIKVERHVADAHADKAKGFGVHVPLRMMRAKSVRRETGEEVIPFILRASNGTVMRAEELFSFYVAELAVSCAVAECTRGVVFVIYPKAEFQVVAYIVSFRGVRDMRALVGQKLEELRAADEHEDPARLDECAPFMVDGCCEDCLCREGS